MCLSPQSHGEGLQWQRSTPCLASRRRLTCYPADRFDCGFPTQDEIDPWASRRTLFRGSPAGVASSVLGGRRVRGGEGHVGFELGAWCGGKAGLSSPGHRVGATACSVGLLGLEGGRTGAVRGTTGADQARAGHERASVGNGRVGAGIDQTFSCRADSEGSDAVVG